MKLKPGYCFICGVASTAGLCPKDECLEKFLEMQKKEPKEPKP